MSDDDFATFRQSHLPPDLQSWNIADLQDYIQRLEKEIVRAKEKIAEKQAVGDAAASLFKN